MQLSGQGCPAYQRKNEKMIWHIAKRELYENLNSLRFGLTTILLLALMLTNAVVHLHEHPKRMQKYHDAVTKSRNVLRERADNLYELVKRGPGKLYKNPSSLHFCADGGDAFLPNVVDGGSGDWSWGDGLHAIWRLKYPSVTPNLDNIEPDVTQVDWGFIVGYVLSLMALLFTFDAIAGERESGTLRLMLANPIPRHAILFGKFIGAFVSILIPFTIAVLMNLLVISTSRSVHLDADAWGRLGIIFCIALLYLCIFLALGLLVSARVQRSAVSLVILLLTWVTFVVFMPSTLASIASGFSSPMSADEYRKRADEVGSNLWKKYATYDENKPEKRIRELSEYVTEEARQHERLNEERLTQQLAQIHEARSITRISPAATVQHLFEVFAGTGFERHRQFLANVKPYARQFREFVIDEDRGDVESLHAIGVREGMSQKECPIEAVPKFEDAFSLIRDFDAAVMDLLLLVLFFIVLMSAAYLAFVRAEI